MAGFGLSVVLLGGLMGLIAGAGSNDWVGAGIGVGLMGIGLLVWELITTVVEAGSRDRSA